MTPTGVTVGASGAIYGILGAAIVLERQGTYVLGGAALPLLIVNIAFSFAVPGISIGRPSRWRSRRRPHASSRSRGLARKRCVLGGSTSCRS